MHGVLLLDKDPGVSSNAALQHAKRLYRAEKAGHTGTLDPLASGLLPLCFGAATKFAQASLDADKRYLATLRLGVTTTTGDLEGEVVRTDPESRSTVPPSSRLAAGSSARSSRCRRCTRRSSRGKPLYEYARAGVEVERRRAAWSHRRIRVVDGADDRWTIDVPCSKGTYIRTLAEEIGAALGCGAHLAALRRTGSGALRACAASARRARRAGRGRARRLPAAARRALADDPRVALDDADAGRFLAGVRRRLDWRRRAAVRVYGAEPAPSSAPATSAPAS